MTFKNPILQYVNRLFIACSILLNVILGGKSNQTFSARNYARKISSKPNLVWLIDTALWFDKDHCELAYDFWLSIRQCYPEDKIFR
jgi:hypothetical protein